MNDESKQISTLSTRQIMMYKIFKAIMVFGFLSGGLSQFFRVEAQVNTFEHLGYPLYLMTILGTWKILGGIVLLIPRLALVKIWAHAGLFFVTTGAVVSHIISGDGVHAFAPLVVAAITVISCILHLKYYGIKMETAAKRSPRELKAKRQTVQ